MREEFLMLKTGQKSGADDLFPILIFIILNSNPENFTKFKT